MPDRDSGPELLQRALAGDDSALRPLVDLLAPIVQARVARALLRGGTTGRELRQHVEDFTQEVFAGLFDGERRALRAWDPARGMSLVNYVGLLAEHQVVAILRTGRRNPWREEATEDEELARSAGGTESPESRVWSREVLGQLLERLRAELTPRGFLLFQLLLVEERGVEEVCEATGMSPDAVYAWRSRLGKTVRRLIADIASSDSTRTPHIPSRREERSAS
jgi:RNA polymerase sigma-70 factor (ECF subfamily)